MMIWLIDLIQLFHLYDMCVHTDSMLISLCGGLEDIFFHGYFTGIAISVGYPHRLPKKDMGRYIT